MFSDEFLEYFKLINENELNDIECCKMESEIPNIWELLCVKKAIETYNKKSYSFITSLFQNLVVSTLQCPDCNYHTYNFDPTNILSIPIPNERVIDMDKINEKLERVKHLPQDKLEQIKNHLINSECNNQSFKLTDCFNNLVCAEKLDDTNKWHCPHCDAKVNAFKKINIWLPSKILIIQLKRFVHNFTSMGYSASKLNNIIEYPITDFNINSYMSDYSSKLGDFTYDLISVTNHIGNINGGHYYAYVKSNSDNKWYCTDDDNVTQISEDNVISGNAYILFYKLRE